jgi:hypothetical protein
MNRHFNRLIKSLALALVGALASTPAWAEADGKTPDLSGTWTMSLIGDHVIPLGLSLKQEGAALSGTLTMMGKDIPMKGELANGAFTLTGSATMMMRDHAAAEGTPAAQPSLMPMKFTGTVQKDGTLAGELAGPRGPMKWTADRLKERAATAPSPNPGAVEGFAGAWNASVVADHVTPVGLQVRNEGGKPRGTLTLMGADIPLEGEVASGVLTMNGEFTEQATAQSGMRGAIRISAKIKEDGTLAGDFAIAHGTFPMTATRMKERPAGSSPR